MLSNHMVKGVVAFILYNLYIQRHVGNIMFYSPFDGPNEVALMVMVFIYRGWIRTGFETRNS